MKYISTRNPDVAVSGSTAVLTGLAPDGGLYVPESFPETAHSLKMGFSRVARRCIFRVHAVYYKVVFHKIKQEIQTL